MKNLLATKVFKLTFFLFLIAVSSYPNKSFSQTQAGACVVLTNLVDNFLQLNLALSSCSYNECVNYERVLQHSYTELAGPPLNQGRTVIKNRKLYCVPDRNNVGRVMVCTDTYLDVNGAIQSTNYQLAKDILRGVYSSSNEFSQLCMENTLYNGAPYSIRERVTSSPNPIRCNLNRDRDTWCDALECGTSKTYNRFDVMNTTSTKDDLVIFCDYKTGATPVDRKMICANVINMKCIDINTRNPIDDEKNDFDDYLSFGKDPYEYYRDVTQGTLILRALGKECVPDPVSCIPYQEYIANGRVPSLLPISFRNVDPVDPKGLIRNMSQLFFGVAAFIFVLLMTINGISLIRSSSNPEQTKKAKEGLFNAFAGFLFILFAGGFIINIISNL